MKLWKKLTVLFLLFLISSLAVCGAITLYHTRKINIDRTVSNYKRQLEAVSYTFDQFGARQEFVKLSGMPIFSLSLRSAAVRDMRF